MRHAWFEYCCGQSVRCAAIQRLTLPDRTVRRSCGEPRVNCQSTNNAILLLLLLAALRLTFALNARPILALSVSAHLLSLRATPVLAFCFLVRLVLSLSLPRRSLSAAATRTAVTGSGVCGWVGSLLVLNVRSHSVQLELQFALIALRRPTLNLHHSHPPLCRCQMRLQLADVSGRCSPATTTATATTAVICLPARFFHLSVSR